MNPAKRKKILRLKNAELQRAPKPVVSVVEKKVEVKKESAPVVAPVVVSVAQETQVVKDAAPLQETTVEMGLKIADESPAAQQLDNTKKDKKKKSFTQDV